MPDDSTSSDTSKVLEAFQRKLEKTDGDAQKLALQLFSENFDLRSEKRSLNDQLEQGKARRTPDGAIVLEGDDVTLYQALTAHTPLKDLQGRFDAAESSIREAGALRRSSSVRDAAESYGLKPAALTKLLQADALELNYDAAAEREIEQGGKKSRVSGVATVTVDGKPVALDAYASSNWADFMPSLTSTPLQVTREALPTGGGNNAPRAPKTLEQLQTEKASSGDYKF